MTELMSSGIELMFAGMTIVFLFLTMLVGAINLMSSLVQRFFPEQPTPSVHVTTGGVDKSVIPCSRTLKKFHYGVYSINNEK